VVPKEQGHRGPRTNGFIPKVSGLEAEGLGAARECANIAKQLADIGILDEDCLLSVEKGGLNRQGSASLQRVWLYRCRRLLKPIHV
jgi:hypothetical protein